MKGYKSKSVKNALKNQDETLYGCVFPSSTGYQVHLLFKTLRMFCQDNAQLIDQEDFKYECEGIAWVLEQFKKRGTELECEIPDWNLFKERL